MNKNAQKNYNDTINSESVTRTTLLTRITTWWNNLNDPQRIEQKIASHRNRSERILLEDNAIHIALAAFVLAVSFICSFFHFYTGEYGKFILECFPTAFAFIIFDELMAYRRIIPRGLEERELYLRKLRRDFACGYTRFCRAIRRVCWLAIAVVVLSIALQYVPSLANHAPLVAETSSWVVDTFNSLLEKVIAYLH